MTVYVQGIEISVLHRQLKDQLSIHAGIQNDSYNISVPPSKVSVKAQTIKRIPSLRKKSVNPNDGQVEHEGTTLKL